GVERQVVLHMTVAVHDHLMPTSQIGRNRRQRLQQWSFRFVQHQWVYARRAVDAHAGFLHHPLPRLRVQVGQVAELARGQEVALVVLPGCTDDALLLRIVRWARVDLEAVALGAFGVRALHQRVVRAGFHDGALGVVNHDARGYRTEPFEGPAVATQPG